MKWTEKCGCKLHEKTRKRVETSFQNWQAKKRGTSNLASNKNSLKSRILLDIFFFHTQISDVSICLTKKMETKHMPLYPSAHTPPSIYIFMTECHSNVIRNGIPSDLPHPDISVKGRKWEICEYEENIRRWRKRILIVNFVDLEADIECTQTLASLIIIIF
jgi:hypothetical protein